MPRFDAFLTEVQQRMCLDPVMDLIRNWTKEEISSVENAITKAVRASGIVGKKIPDFVGTNQAKGNKADNHFLAVVPAHLQ